MNSIFDWKFSKKKELLDAIYTNVDVLVRQMNQHHWNFCFKTPPLLNDKLDKIMIDFNSISTRLKLFYADWLRNCVHCIFTFTFFAQLFLKNF